MQNPFEEITQRLSKIEHCLLDIKENSKAVPFENPDQLFSIDEASEFLSLSKATLYSKVSRGELPVMKRSKRLYFSRVELMGYLKEGRKKTNAEIEAEADQYLAKKKGGNQL